MGRKGSGKAESTPRRAHTPFRHPSPCIVRAGPRPQPFRAARRPRPPSLRQAAPAEAATQSPGSQPRGARARGEGASATDLRGCCGRAASAGDTDRWAHGGVALGRPPLLCLRWRQYLLSPPTSLPPTPPPPSPPPPPPNHRSTEGETQRLTTTWLPPPPPLPSPPASGRAQGTPGDKGGGALTDVLLFSVASDASPALRAPAGGSSARAHALCARAFRPFLPRVLTRPHLAG